ncbi:unnamed protein product [Brassica rapa subsp. narinosa]
MMKDASTTVQITGRGVALVGLLFCVYGFTGFVVLITCSRRTFGWS